MDLRSLLEEVKTISRNELDITECEDFTIFVSKNLLEALNNPPSEQDRQSFDELVVECIKHLKVMCTKGPTFQNLIINTTGIFQMLYEVINGTSTVSKTQEIKFFQLIANLCVNNKYSQGKIWNSMNELIVEKLKCDDAGFINVAAMIIYNIVLSETTEMDLLRIAQECLKHFESFLTTPEKPLPDFVHILLESLLCKSYTSVDIYKQLEPEQQKTSLYFIHDFVSEESNCVINNALMQLFTTEFKSKSDCILKTVTTYVEAVNPQIVVSLLDIISTATSQNKYLVTLKNDHSLFLNLGCLLQALHKIGKNADASIFTPIQKLDALVPTSNVNGDFEKDVSYSLKSKLVKSLANLSHRNKRNQELAREMEIMLSIFECTNADARNPLIKEWSILAIKHLCEDNPENQEIVAQLTKVGNAENPLLKEMGLENGMLRIGKQ